MKILSRLACAAALLAALAPVTGCGDDDNPTNPISGQARVMAVHTVPDATAPVDVLVNGQVVVNDLTYPNNSNYITVNAGNALDVKVMLEGNPTPVLQTSLLANANTSTTVFATGTVAAVQAVVLTDDLTAPPAGQAKVRFVHLSPDALPVDVAVAGTGGAVWFDNTAFRASKPFRTVPAGTYDLEVRADNAASALLTIPSVTFEAGKIYTLYTRGLVAGTAGTALASRVIVHN